MQQSGRNTMVLAATLLASMLVSGCAPSLSSNVYSRDETRIAQEVQFGTVEYVRTVQIEGTKSPIGSTAGAAIGGIGGSELGKGGKSSAIGAIGGAVIGGLIGAAAEEGLTRQAGIEVTVRLDNGRLLSVVQGADEPFAPGERVRILTTYNGTMRITH